MTSPALAERNHAEPRFDLPPRLGGTIEHRLAGRATALWRERRGDRAMPSAIGYDGDGGLLPIDDFSANSVMLGLAVDDGAIIAAVSPDVAAAFGIHQGLLSAGAGDTLAARLVAACGVLGAFPAVVPFEGLLAATDAAAPTLLTRGVVLPLGDAAGRLCAAHVVVTWKEILAPHARDGLRRELDLVFGERRLSAATFAAGNPFACH